MSYTNETTHYGIPLPLGTDLTTPMDYNESMEAIDTAVFGAVTDAASASEVASKASTDVATLTTEVGTLETSVSTLESTVTSHSTAITNNANEIDDVRQDCYDLIEPYQESSATSTRAYEVDDYFIYNDTLYKCTVAIAVGDTIVPNTNCVTTSVCDELENSLIPEDFSSDLTFNTSSSDVPLTVVSKNCYRIGKLAFITFQLNFSSFAGAGVLYSLGTLSSNKPISVLFSDANFSGEDVECIIETDGTINFRSSSQGSAVCGFTMMYLIS